VSVGGVLEAARNLASPLRRIGRSSHLAGPILVVALGLTGLSFRGWWPITATRAASSSSDTISRPRPTLPMARSSARRSAMTASSTGSRPGIRSCFTLRRSPTSMPPGAGTTCNESPIRRWPPCSRSGRSVGDLALWRAAVRRAADRRPGQHAARTAAPVRGRGAADPVRALRDRRRLTPRAEGLRRSRARARSAPHRPDWPRRACGRCW